MTERSADRPSEDLVGRNDRAVVLRAISTSCVPLLCGNGDRAYATARHLFRAYGITSYLLLPKRARRAGFLTRLLSAPVARTLPSAPSSPALITETAIAFFASAPPPSIPVLIDCTDGCILFADPAVRARLEAHCFLSTADTFADTPPFSYLNEPLRQAKPPEGGSTPSA